MELKNLAPVLFVRDAARSRDFYTDTLGFTVTGDFGGMNYIFKEGFAIWQILDENIIPQTLGKENIYNAEATPRSEFVFETEDIDEVFETLKAKDVKFLHGINTELWGQRTVRFYDPDGHLLEAGETMHTFTRRIYLEEGEDLEKAAARMYMTPDILKQFIG